MKTVKWQAGPGKTLACSTSVDASSQLKQSSPKVALYLWSQGRKMKVILGDGNCLFRAVAHIIYGTEESHATVRRILVTFVSKNKPVLVKYVTNGSLRNTLKLSPEKEPGELKLSCMLQQACTNYLYIFSHHTHKPTTIDGFFLSLSNTPTFPMQKTVHHHRKQIQSSRTSNYAFRQETLPTSPPQLDHTSSYIHIC